MDQAVMTVLSVVLVPTNIFRLPYWYELHLARCMIYFFMQRDCTALLSPASKQVNTELAIRRCSGVGDINRRFVTNVLYNIQVLHSYWTCSVTSP